MTAGKPVVASHVGGIPEIVVDGVTGILVPPADPAALAEAMMVLAGSEGLRQRLRAAGRDRACTHFTWDRQIQRPEGLYQEAL